MKEALKLALEGVSLYEITGRIEDIDKCIVHHFVIKETLAQPEQSKVGCGEYAVCCGKYATCLKPCTPRGRWMVQAEQEPVTPEDTVSNRRAISEDAGAAIAIMQRMQRTIKRLKARPEQEPCGRLEPDPEDGHVFVPRIEGDWSMLGKDLYTTPPQRNPLTDEREEFKRYIDECDECSIVPDVAGAFNAGWKAAQGIKEQS